MSSESALSLRKLNLELENEAGRERMCNRSGRSASRLSLNLNKVTRVFWGQGMAYQVSVFSSFRPRPFRLVILCLRVADQEREPRPRDQANLRTKSLLLMTGSFKICSFSPCCSVPACTLCTPLSFASIRPASKPPNCTSNLETYNLKLLHWLPSLPTGSCQLNFVLWMLNFFHSPHDLIEPSIKPCKVAPLGSLPKVSLVCWSALTSSPWSSAQVAPFSAADATGQVSESSKV